MDPLKETGKGAGNQMKLEKWQCGCKGCTEKREAMAKQLENKFYKKVEDFRNEIRLQQLEKAAEKYTEPFNPDSWTGEELAIHAMQENFDQSVYITGLYDRIQELEQKCDYWKERAKYWRTEAIKDVQKENR